MTELKEIYDELHSQREVLDILEMRVHKLEQLLVDYDPFPDPTPEMKARAVSRKELEEKYEQ